ncbi:hypothetical protein [Mycobacterium sp. 3519A]|uniref:type VII secretion target n=1 Tax=Mycobacterium sp. 3519A TaxID=2057184 RepID=UPI001158655D|nr:hypothetical protein [Mycobacterium sp. 3519A]
MPSSSGDAVPPGSEVPGPVGGYRNAPVSAPGFTSTVPNLPGGPPGLSGVFVDTDALNRAAAVAADAASEAGSDAQRLDSAVNRSGPAPWGDDPGLGQSFGSVFADPRHSLVQAIDALPEVLGDLADTLRQTSATFAEADGDAM